MSWQDTAQSSVSLGLSRQHEDIISIPSSELRPPNSIKPNSTQTSFAPLLPRTDLYPEEHGATATANVEKKKGVSVSRGSCAAVGRFLRSKLLLILSILGIVLGFLIGFLIRPYKPSEDILMWLGFPGDIFLSLLKMTILPLIISSVITATSSMDPRQNGRIGGLQVTYLALTNLMGAIMGITLAVTIKPGAHMGENSNNATSDAGLRTTDIFADLIRNIFPDNIVRATMQKKMTSYERVASINIHNISEEDVYEMRREVIYSNSTNVIGLIFVCAIFGIAAGQAKEKGKAFLSFFQSTSEIVLIIIGWFLWVSPLGICSLIAVSIASINDLGHTFSRLGLFVAAVSAGIVVHQLVVMPTIHLITTRTNPFKVLARSMKAWFVGFASTSSAGAMPYMYEIADSYGVDQRVSGFCIPIGVTLNADGSALFICTAVIFLAQLHGIVMDSAQLAVLGSLTTISTLALPSVPSSSLVVIVIICTALAIPASSIGLLFTVEWLLDRLRTTSNIVTEIFAFLFVWHQTKHELRESDRKADREAHPEEYDDTVPDLPTLPKYYPGSPGSSINGSMRWILGTESQVGGSKLSLASFHGM